MEQNQDTSIVLYPVYPQLGDVLPYTKDAKIAPWATGAPMKGYAYYARDNHERWHSKKITRPAWALCGGQTKSGLWVWIAAARPLEPDTKAIKYTAVAGRHTIASIAGVVIADIWMTNTYAYQLTFQNDDAPGTIKEMTFVTERDAKRALIHHLNRRWAPLPSAHSPAQDDNQCYVIGTLAYTYEDNGDFTIDEEESTATRSATCEVYTIRQIPNHEGLMAELFRRNEIYAAIVEGQTSREVIDIKNHDINLFPIHEREYSSWESRKLILWNALVNPAASVSLIPITVSQKEDPSPRYRLRNRDSEEWWTINEEQPNGLVALGPLTTIADNAQPITYAQICDLAEAIVKQELPVIIEQI